MSNEYKDVYSEESFWDKTKNQAIKAGKEVILQSLKIYFSSKNPKMSILDRTTCYGALGYFIFPLDAIPDITPFIGYSDDLGILTLAIKSISSYITNDTNQLALNKMKEWFS